jgi:hypothetical protein
MHSPTGPTHRLHIQPIYNLAHRAMEPPIPQGASPLPDAEGAQVPPIAPLRPWPPPPVIFAAFCRSGIKAGGIIAKIAQGLPKT